MPCRASRARPDTRRARPRRVDGGQRRSRDGGRRGRGARGDRPTRGGQVDGGRPARRRLRPQRARGRATTSSRSCGRASCSRGCPTRTPRTRWCSRRRQRPPGGWPMAATRWSTTGWSAPGSSPSSPRRARSHACTTPCCCRPSRSPSGGFAPARARLHRPRRRTAPAPRLPGRPGRTSPRRRRDRHPRGARRHDPAAVGGGPPALGVSAREPVRTASAGVAARAPRPALEVLSPPGTAPSARSRAGAPPRRSARARPAWRAGRRPR